MGRNIYKTKLHLVADYQELSSQLVRSLETCTDQGLGFWAKSALLYDLSTYIGCAACAAEYLEATQVPLMAVKKSQAAYQK